LKTKFHGKFQNFFFEFLFCEIFILGSGSRSASKKKTYDKLIVFSHCISGITSWYYYPGIIGHYLAFFAGLFFMIVYYVYFHPTGIDVAFLRKNVATKIPGLLPAEDHIVAPTDRYGSICPKRSRNNLF
jgi:hypothetical protein